MTLAALSAPVVNTGIFFVMMALFFRDAIRESCGLEGGNVVAFIITGFIGINFLIEFALNTVLCPAIARILAAVRTHRPTSARAASADAAPFTADPVASPDGEIDRGPYGGDTTIATDTDAAADTKPQD